MPKIEDLPEFLEASAALTEARELVSRSQQFLWQGHRDWALEGVNLARSLLEALERLLDPIPAEEPPDGPEPGIRSKEGHHR